MKGLGKILFGAAVLTATLLLYVHERVEMLKVSYQIYDRSSDLSKKGEEFRRLKFEVSQLRSPQVLEKRLEELALPLTLPKEIKALRVPEPVTRELGGTLATPPPTGNLFDFLGQWVQIAQARTDQ